jgi:hypothetical protein
VDPARIILPFVIRSQSPKVEVEMVVLGRAPLPSCNHVVWDILSSVF